jgi:DNA-binding transcriptional regulator YiaG
LFQADLAKILGVDVASIRNWEQGVLRPAKIMEPRIISWLGFDPKLR